MSRLRKRVGRRSFQPRTTAAEMHSTVRIFLASPGDVPDERALARGVVQQIANERAFRERFSLQIVAWDQPGMAVPMEGALTPQAAIDDGLKRPSECDLVVAIFWSRMGTRLPSEFRKADGSAYLSGTEWEVLDALNAARERQSPKVWIYRRAEVPRIPMDAADFEDRLEQWKRIQAWFDSLIAPDGSHTAGVNTYSAPSEFQRDFEHHLRDYLARRIERLDESETPPPASAPHPEVTAPAYRRNPYPGLEAFTEEQQGIFFGRAAETDELLALFTDTATRFLCVVGASGSGKSSLVAAGLVPRLQAGAVAGSQAWRYVRFKPGERGGDPFLSLAYPLKQALALQGVSETAIADQLRADPVALAGFLEANSPLLIFIDQFEELFTVGGKESTDPILPAGDPVPGSNDERRFLDFVDRSLAIAGVRVVATLRSDFYDKLAEHEAFAARLRRSGTFTLAAPGVGALNEMILRPAEQAGLVIEEELRQRLLDDTAAKPGGLALLAFALNRLYECARESGELTLADYRAIDGVEGAIRQRAESVLKRFGNLRDEQLAPIFAELVEVDERDVATRRRTTMARLAADETCGAIVEALIEARLLVVSGEQHQAQVDVAHEAVFSAWPRLSRWIEQNGARLRVKRSLERAARDWNDAGAKAFSHLPDRAMLKSYQQVEEGASETAQLYLHTGRRRQRIRNGALAVACLVAVVLVANAWLATRESSWNALSIALLALSGMYQGPEMVTIRPGQPLDSGQGRFNEAFVMGAMEGDEDERPPRQVTVAKSLEIGRYEVTFDEFSAYALATGREVPHDEDWGRGRMPIINVTWEEATAYAEWLSEVTGKRYRLPTEAEWEYAARAGTDTPFWWGKEINADDRVWANCDGCGSPWDKRQPAPVGSFSPNAFGLYDTAGNAYEWVQDCRHENYVNGPTDGSAWLEGDDGDCSMRSIRGGSWDREPVHVRSSNRYRYPVDRRYNYVGFRLARDLD